MSNLMARRIEAARREATETHLDDMNPAQLERFLRDYLVARAHESGDIEHADWARGEYFDLNAWRFTISEVPAPPGDRS